LPTANFCFEGATTYYLDDFVHLDGRTAVALEVRPNCQTTQDEFVKSLRARSLFDTYSGMKPAARAGI